MTIALTLSLLGSYWIDCLYRRPNAPLSFPDEIDARSKYRKLILFVLMTTGFLSMNPFVATKSLYLMAAIFFLSLVTVTDFEQYIIFDKMLLPFAVVGLIATIHLEVIVGEVIVDKVIAAVIGGVVFLLLAIVTRGGIGGGDIKLVAALGLWLGSEKLFDVVTIACVLGGLGALLQILLKQKDRKSFFAYGPYFSLTTLYVLIMGE